MVTMSQGVTLLPLGRWGRLSSYPQLEHVELNALTDRAMSLHHMLAQNLLILG